MERAISLRFIFWDDYRPLEYAALPNQAVPVDTFLSLFGGQFFEANMSQSFHDGNDDVKWTRGALMTAKEQDLWKPMPDRGVTEEDVKHMKKLVLCFPCVGANADDLQLTIEP